MLFDLNDSDILEIYYILTFLKNTRELVPKHLTRIA